MSETKIEEQDQKLVAYKGRLEDMLQKQQESLPILKERALARMAFFTERNGVDDPSNHSLAFGGLRSREHAIQITKDKLELARPTSEADVAYRMKVMRELGPAIQQSIPKGLPLRFHGTPFYNVPGILQDGGLTSAVDRLGAAASYDTADQVSVTTAETLSTTLDSYVGLLDEDCMLPAGCIFVILPASEQEERAGSSMLMGNVNFTEHPEQLVGILTSDENLDSVRQMSTAAGIDPAKVKEFFEFPAQLSALDQQIQAGDVSLQSLVPYELPA